jgi:hypothetical protein
MLVLLRFGAGVPIGTWYSGQILHGPDSRCMVDHKDARCWSPVRISRQAILNQRTLSVIMVLEWITKFMYSARPYSGLPYHPRSGSAISNLLLSAFRFEVLVRTELSSQDGQELAHHFKQPHHALEHNSL